MSCLFFAFLFAFESEQEYPDVLRSLNGPKWEGLTRKTDLLRNSFFMPLIFIQAFGLFQFTA
jgi:hypothetical protein